MAEFNRAGQIVTGDYMRAERKRKGLCTTCRTGDPTKCYKIKSRMGGFYHNIIPLTEPYKVFEGICLVCHPEKDPDKERKRHKRKSKRPSRRRDEEHRRRPGENEVVRPHDNAHDIRNPSHRIQPRDQPCDDDDDIIRRSKSERVPSTQRNGPTRQSGFRNLARSMPANMMNEDDINHSQRLGDDYKYEEEDVPKDPPDQQEEEKFEINIFGNPVPAKPRRESSKRRSHKHSQSQRHHSSAQAGGAPHPYEDERAEEQGHNSPPRPSRGNDVHDSSNTRPPPSNSTHFEGQHKQDLPIPAPVLNNNNGTHISTDDEPLDMLAMLCQNHMNLHQLESVRFVPGGQFLKNSTIKVQENEGDEGTIISGITAPTCFQGRPSLATTTKSIGTGNVDRSRRMDAAGVDPGGDYLSVISETSTGASSEMQRSMVSHQIREPVMEDEVPKEKPPQTASAEGENHNDAQGLEIPSAPELSALREFVEMCTQADEDAEAINQITQALLIDNDDTMKVLDHGNAGNKSMDLVLFCLTTLWILARKSDENKHEIIFADRTFAAVLEAMDIHCDKIEAQSRACAVLWSLSMDPNERKHVAQAGGCDAILNAMLMHTEEDALQVMALGALKVLSFDSTGKATLRSRGVLQIVADIMQRHLINPTVQTEGCVILSNLVVDDATQGVVSVTENEVEAVVKGILAHPDSLQVHEAACFALRRFASAAANVDLIRCNNNTTEALQLAFQKHPDEVGINILTLWKRLRLQSSEV